MTGPNNFFHQDGATRRNARSSWETWFVNQVIPVLKQSGIDLYGDLDQDLVTLPNSFQAVTGDFEAVRAGFPPQWTDATRRLVQLGENNFIHIWLVKTIWDAPNGYVDASTVPHGMTWSRTMLLADIATPTILAHELRHCVAGGQHIVNYDDLTGQLNNLKGVIGDETFPANGAMNPLNWNLMRQTCLRRSDSNGWWLTDAQVFESRHVARFVNPAFREID